MSILETLCEERKADAARLKRERPPSSLERAAGPPRAAFALGPMLVAECKKASPSRGLLVPDYDPVRLAEAYESGGALMVSVLTEPRRFLGSDEHLSAVRGAVGLPVLRKDFIVDPYQILEAWAIGADAVLLIAAALSRIQLLELSACARELALAILVETRDEFEIEEAVTAKPDAIGVNARDLRDFSVDRERSAALFYRLPQGVLRVAESGMKEPKDAAALRALGFDAFLIGEALATAADPERATREFVKSIGTPT